MNREQPPPVRHWFWAGVLLTVVKLWFVRAQSICAIGTADHDDRLFLQLAEHLSRGDWLGPYNPLTLAQGPFYPGWVALIHVVGLPLFFAQHLLYATACALFVRACRPAISSGAARLGIYALLLCNPMSFDASSMGRVLPQHVYGPLVMLMFAALIAFYLRRNQPFRRLVPWAALLGLAFAGLWLTREEISWIVPSLLLLAGTSLVNAWRTSRENFLRMSRAFALAGLCALVPLLAVSGLNYSHYGCFGIVEHRTPVSTDVHGFVPPLPGGQTAGVTRTFAECADFTVSFRSFSAYAPPSIGTAGELEIFQRMTREKLSPGPGTAALPAPSASDVEKTERLQRIGRALRPMLLSLFWTAQTLALVRGIELLRRRRGSFPLTVAAAAWSAGVAYLLINVLNQVTVVPVLVISSFAPVYPLVLVFIVAVSWDVSVAWIIPRLPQQPSSAVKVGGHVSAPVGEESVNPVASGLAKFLPWLTGLLALAPLVIWHAEFAKLFWFADDFLLLDQIDRMGFWPWVTAAFTESFAPLFKLPWGGAVFIFGGSYFSLIVLLWLTHAFNTLCLGWLLVRAGFSWFVTLLVQVVFALTSANLETLGWSVQWSAVLATTFFLLALLWQEKHAGQSGRWQLRVHGPLLLLAMASACSFARGVLTGAVLALAMLPLASGSPCKESLSRVPLAIVMLVPSLAVTLVILLFAHGNQQHPGGHVGEMTAYAVGYFLLNPAYLLLGLASWQPEALVVLAAVKLGLIYWGLTHSIGRQRLLLVLLLAYDLGNAVLLGIGRYHTGFETVVSSRYNYSSLLATLPFAALWLEYWLNRLIARARVRQTVAFLALAGVLWFGLHDWPRELASFTGWRGTDMRRLMQDEAAARGGATVPALGFMRTDRAIELIHRYNLH